MNCVHVPVHGVDNFASCIYIIYIYLGGDV